MIRKKGITKMYGNILMLNPMEQDTLYITADTLVAIDSDDPKQKRLLAYHHVKMYKADLKGKCDSLVYHSSDSTIHFYGNPIMWSEKNQIVSDSMYAELKNNKLDKIL
jgi:lipopolysaccharide export system protein LptA